MSDIRAINGRYGQVASSMQPPSRTSVAGQITPSEAELLRVIERALEEQRRAREKAEAPLASRIEAILSPKMEPANDAAAAVPPAPASRTISPPPATAPTIAANVNEPVPFELEDEPRRNFTKPFAIAAIAAILGAALPVLMTPAPVRYAAETALRVSGDVATRPALTAAAARKLLSTASIAATVSSLKLDRDPEFIGGKPNAAGIVFDLLSGSGAAADAASRAEASLVAAIETAPDMASGLVGLKVTTSSAAKSKLIVSRLAQVLTAAEPGKAPEAEAALRKDYEAARAALDAFTAKSGEGNVRVAVNLQQQINQLDADLKVAEQRITLSKERADRLKASKVETVINGALPLDMMSPALQEARDRYSVEKAALSQLAVDLGPRHPKLLAQQANVDSLREKLSQELARQVKDAAVDAKSAVDARRKLSDQRNILIAQSRDTGVDLAKLTELRDKAEAAKSRFDEIAPSDIAANGAITLQNAPKVSAVSSGYSSPVRSAIGAAAGLALGFAAMLIAAIFGRRLDSEPELMEPVTLENPVGAEALPDEAPDELEMLRAELAELRSKFRSYSANAR